MTSRLTFDSTMENEKIREVRSTKCLLNFLYFRLLLFFKSVYLFVFLESLCFLLSLSA